MSLVFFDVDGTLLLTGGAGVRAMTRAFASVFGVADAFAGFAIGGRTDTYLVSTALTRGGLPDSVEQHRRFRDAYLPLLEEEVGRPGSGRRGVMPGVVALLEALHARAPFQLALLTGNYEPAARIKLAHFGLERYFAWGVFGEESIDRNELGRVGLARAAARGIDAGARARATIIGDTPYDIECARAVGARSLGVATGSHPLAALEDAGADAVLSDLSDTARVVDLLR